MLTWLDRNTDGNDEYLRYRALNQDGADTLAEAVRDGGGTETPRREGLTS